MTRVYLSRVYLNNGGYDSTGYYYGRGGPLYQANHDDWERPMVFRADSREDAKDIVRKRHPAATFFN